MIIDRKFKARFDKEMGPASFALFMKVARTSLGVTQDIFGKKLGISRASVCGIEKGRHLVSPGLAVRVARKAGLLEKLALQYCLQDQVRQAGSKYTVQVT